MCRQFNFPIHSFKIDGSEKKKIADGMLLKAENGKVIYCVYNEKIPGRKSRKVSGQSMVAVPFFELPALTQQVDGFVRQRDIQPAT